MSQAGILDIEGSNPQIPTSFTTDSGTAVPIANVLEILGGTNINTSASGNTIIINSTVSGISWVRQSTNITAVKNTGYFAISATVRPAGGLHLTLPSPAIVGDTFRIYDFNGNGWFVLQTGAETIKIGNKISTSGTGSIFSANSTGGDSATLVCGDSTLGAEVWCVVDYAGNIGVN